MSSQRMREYYQKKHLEFLDKHTPSYTYYALTKTMDMGVTKRDIIKVYCDNKQEAKRHMENFYSFDYCKIYTGNEFLTAIINGKVNLNVLGKIDDRFITALESNSDYSKGDIKSILKEAKGSKVNQLKKEYEMEEITEIKDYDEFWDFMDELWQAEQLIPRTPYAIIGNYRMRIANREALSLEYRHGYITLEKKVLSKDNTFNKTHKFNLKVGFTDEKLNNKYNAFRIKGIISIESKQVDITVFQCSSACKNIMDIMEDN